MSTTPQGTGTTGSAGKVDINTSNYTNQFVGPAVNVLSSNLLPYMFGDSTAGNMASGLIGSTLSGITEGFLKDGTKGAFQLGWKGGATALAGIGSGLIGNGIESIGGHSKTSKFLGGATSSALGTLGSNLILNGTISNWSSNLSKVGAINPWGFGMSVVGSGLSAMNGPSKEYNGTYGGITRTMDTVYDAATGIVGAINPVVGGAMVLNKGLSNLFGSTDGMTVQDAILGSSFTPAPVKWLNMAGAKKTGTFNDYSWQNMEKASGVLGSYGNLESKFEKAMKEAGKTYGTFSRGARKKALRNLDYANNAWETIQDIADLAELGEVRSARMASVNSARYAQDIQGGLNLYYRGKHGMKIPKAQYGTILNLRLRMLNIKPRTRTLSELIDYALLVNPRFIQRLEEPNLRYIQTDSGIASHLLSYAEVDGKTIVYPIIMEDENGELKMYPKNKAPLIAIQRGDFLEMSPEEAEIFTKGYKEYEPWFEKIKKADDLGSISRHDFFNTSRLGKRTGPKPYFNMMTGTLGYSGDDVWNSYFDLYDLKFEFLKKGGTLKKKIKLVGKDFKEGEYIEVGPLSTDLKAGRVPIGKDKKGRDIYLNGDGVGILNPNERLTAFKEGGIIDFLLKGKKVKKVRISPDDPRGYHYDPEENTIYYGGNTRKEVKESKKHEMFHAKPNENFIEFLRPYYENLDDNRIQELGGDLDFVKRIDGDPNRFYSPEEIGARVVAARYRAGNKYFTPEFFRNLRAEEDKYGDNMRDLLHMYNDDILSKIFRKADSLYTAWGGLSSDGKSFKDPNGELGNGKVLKPTGEYDESGRELWESEDGDLFTLKNGGVINSNNYDFMTGALSFRKGGSVNVIPEGALHARKHHMENSEKLTLKGIPVVDTDGKQQAEIECNEIIFRKEVTDKIEQLRKKFKEASNSEKDDLAIQCGKILTKEIINNTEDRTGLLKIIESEVNGQKI